MATARSVTFSNSRERESNVSDLDDEIAAARRRVRNIALGEWHQYEYHPPSILGFDAAGVLLRPKLNAANAEIARWRTWATEMPDYGWDFDGPIKAWYDDAPSDGKAVLAESRTVTDAQRKAIFEFLDQTCPDMAVWTATHKIVAILEQPAGEDAP